jgi:hypothetical protein
VERISESGTVTFSSTESDPFMSSNTSSTCFSVKLLIPNLLYSAYGFQEESHQFTLVYRIRTAMSIGPKSPAGIGSQGTLRPRLRLPVLQTLTWSARKLKHALQGVHDVNRIDLLS